MLLSVKQYGRIEEDLKLLDDLELARMLKEARENIETGNTISHEEVKKRLKFKK